MKKDCVCPRARHQHGTPAGYTTCGCKCFHCRVAYAQQVRDRRAGTTQRRRHGLVDRAGTRRRIEALHAVGWSGAQIGHRLGITFEAVHQLRTKTGPLYVTTAANVAAVYDELWDQPATGGQVVKTRNWAARNGFPLPMQWDDDSIDDPGARPYVGTARSDDMDKAHLIDDIAVAEAVAGRRVGLTVQERRQAVHQLTALGLSAREIGERLGVTGRAVVRGRSAA